MDNDRPLLYTATQAARLLNLGSWNVFTWYSERLGIAPSYTYHHNGKAAPLWTRETLDVGARVIAEDRARSYTVQGKRAARERREKVAA
jgi:hypothetical protein